MTLELTPIVVDEDHYFTIAELRAMDTSYADTDEFPDAALEEVRDGVETDFEEDGHCAFITRSASARLSGDGGTDLFLPNPMVQSITSVTIDGTALSAEALAALIIDDSLVYREDEWPEGRYNIVVEYLHGYETTPVPIKKRALKVAADRLVPSGLPANATSEVVDGATYRIAITNERNPYGDPDIITTIRRFGRSGSFAG